MDDIINPLLKYISDGSLLTASSLAIFVFLYKLWRVLTEDVSRDSKTDSQESLIAEIMKDNERLRKETHILHGSINNAINEKMKQEILIIRYEEYILKLRLLAYQCNPECQLLESLDREKPILELSFDQHNGYSASDNQ